MASEHIEGKQLFHVCLHINKLQFCRFYLYSIFRYNNNVDWTRFSCIFFGVLVRISLRIQHICLLSAMQCRTPG